MPLTLAGSRRPDLRGTSWRKARRLIPSLEPAVDRPQPVRPGDQPWWSCFASLTETLLYRPETG